MDSSEVIVTPQKVMLGKYYQYDPKDQIGQGSYAKVVKGHQIETGRIIAVKICARQKMDQQETISLQKQIHIMKQIHHPNIVDFYAVYSDKKNIYLVLQYLEGGQLYEHILQKQSYSEHEAKQTLLPIIDAVRYLHNSGIVHRDLKPENIVYTEKDGAKVLKIIDFGVSQIISNQTVMSTAIGTPLYMAPQIFFGQKYRGAVDVWSIGVILYILLCGYPPFQGDNQVQLQKEIKQSNIVFDQDDWGQISQEAIDLINKMLERDPAKRIRMQQILQHQWIVNDASKKNLANTKMRFHKAVKKLRTALKIMKLARN